jgi:hypothetical protein
MQKLRSSCGQNWGILAVVRVANPENSRSKNSKGLLEKFGAVLPRNSGIAKIAGYLLLKIATIMPSNGGIAGIAAGP